MLMMMKLCIDVAGAVVADFAVKLAKFNFVVLTSFNAAPCALLQTASSVLTF